MRFPEFGRYSTSRSLPLPVQRSSPQVVVTTTMTTKRRRRSLHQTTQSLSLHFNGLENLGADYVYEGWVANSSGPTSTGRLTINDMGVMSQTTFEIDTDVAEAADTFILTIEPYVDPDPGPSATKVIAGDFDGVRASLHVEHGAALGNTFETAAGEFFLATPTSADPDDGDYGIWFMNKDTGMPGLDLPTLPAGWKYEGWVVVGGKAFSTGTFTATDMPDDDEAGPYAGPGGFPNVPGQDFVDTVMLNLADSTVVISIEPDMDNSPAPFAMKPLVLGGIDGGDAVQTLHSNYELVAYGLGHLGRNGNLDARP